MKKNILFCLFILLLAHVAGAQESYNDRVKKYVAQYYPLALSEQKSTGIPACITLAQGVLETEAGSSDLMTVANNHFGIKCKNGWQGETYLHDDDKRNECFKKYKSADESFRDHSEHLKNNPRYASLFTLSETDYASWALGLKKCGYATNPQYAIRLIKIIEDFKLQEYTYVALDSSILNTYAVLPPAARSETVAARKPADSAAPVASVTPPPAAPIAAPAPIPWPGTVTAMGKADSSKKMRITDSLAKTTPVSPLKSMADSARMVMKKDQPKAIARVDSNKAADTTDNAYADTHYDSSKIVRLNGLKAFYAYKGDVLLQYAVKYHIRYPRLLEINDLPDAPLPYDMYVYLDKKLSAGTHPTHTVQDGETLFMISQAEGVQLKKLLTLNLLNPNEQPLTGSEIQLQKPTLEKPDVRIMEIKAHKENAIIAAAPDDPRQGDDYIAISRPHVSDTPMPAQVITPAAAEPAIAKSEPAQKPVDAVAVKTNAQKNAELEKQAAERAEQKAKDAELAALKENLDKEVYADDSKPVAAAQPKKYELPEQVKQSPVKGEKFYTIKRGDTAFSIAKRNNISVDQLMQWNNIDARDIKTGKRIQVRE